MKTYIPGILLFLILAVPVMGLEAQEYDTKFYMVDDTVVVKHNIVFEDRINGTLSLLIPEDANTIEIHADDKKISFTQDERILMVVFDDIINLRISYLTEDYIEKSSFLASISPLLNSSIYTISVILPERVILKKPIEENDPLSGSFFPKDAQLTSDGKSLIFIWQYQNVTEQDQFSYFIQYQEETNWLPYIVGIVAALIVVLFVLSRKKQRPKMEEKPVVKRAGRYEHLKEEEQAIVNILKKRDGRQIEQGTLRVITRYSKASLSRLLSELEERNIIHKEKRGKKNLIFLK